MKPTLAFVGAGNLANAIAVAAARAGLEVGGIVSLTKESAHALARAVDRTAGSRRRAVAGDESVAPEALRRADVVFLAVPDREIVNTARRFARHFRRGAVVAHSSGAAGPELLNMLQRAGLKTSAFHPIQTFPNRRTGARGVAGSYVTIEGAPRARAVLSAIARRLRMHPIELKRSNRALYHASAAITSNLTVALFDIAREAFVKSTGCDDSTAAGALLPLLEGTVRNVRKIGMPGALSGPIARGDAETIQKHLKALRPFPEAGALYRAAGVRAVELAIRKGSLPASRRAEFIHMLAGAPRGRNK